MPRAARRCPAAGCTELIRNRPYCETHTVAWNGPRTASSNVTNKHVWRHQVTPFVLQRAGYRCQIAYPDRCLGRATIADKIQPAARRPELAMEPSNWQAACKPCNDHKARTTDRKPARR